MATLPIFRFTFGFSLVDIYSGDIRGCISGEDNEHFEEYAFCTLFYVAFPVLPLLHSVLTKGLRNILRDIRGFPFFTSS